VSGLLGLLSRNRAAVSEATARTMLAAIAHRGSQPRLWIGRGIALGAVHRPTTPEAELEVPPLTDDAGSLRLVWDGRLDNRAELIRQLGFRHEPDSITDGQLIIAAYRRWGEDCVDQLAGDWAIVIWDAERRRLFAAKDPIGWRQLFFASTADWLIIGSEPQQVLQGLPGTPRPNSQFVARHMAGAPQELGSTCWEGVSELIGGSLLSVDALGSISIRRYWTGSPGKGEVFRHPEEFAEELSWLIRDAVSRRMRSNGPVGIFLSGGLDSSVIAGAAAESNGDLLAITEFAAELPGLDEREFARAAASWADLPQLEVDISDAWTFNPEIMPDDVFDTPDVPPHGAHLMLAAAAAGQAGRPTILNGEGGDDWWDGDERAAGSAVLSGHLPTAWRIAGRARSPRPLTIFRSLRRAIEPPRGLRLRELAWGSRAPSRFEPIVPSEPDWIAPTSRKPPLWQRRRLREFEWDGHIQRTRATIAWKDRWALQRNGIDVRSPLHDLRIVELAARAPEWMKQYRGRRRDLFRLAGTGLAPASVLNRLEKGHFTELVIHGMSGPGRERIKEGLHVMRAWPEVDQRYLQSRADLLDSISISEWGSVWAIATTGLWLHNSVSIQKPSEASIRRVTVEKEGASVEEAVREA
jgi:asparagine synthase (glutamine-hydrolysing)